MRTIAIIPARSGSKGLVNKNIKMLAGKPMIAYTIEACIASGCFDVVHVSTDSEEYGRIAKHYGAEVPFLREENLASDSATTESVIKSVLQKYREMEGGDREFSHFAIMQPTSPLRTAEDIREAFALLKEKQADSVIGICQMEHSPLWSNTLPDSHSMEGFLSQTNNRERHEFDTYYRINGAMYLVKTDIYTDHMAMYGPRSYGYIMNKSHSVDVDDAFDFRFAEVLLATEEINKCEKTR
ncbi:MAG: acylneuraminate cytidylyltransferase family protein [Lachnospiraceae bacterium]